MGLPFAEDVNYWKTSKSTPDTWLEKAAELIEDLGGKVLGHAFGSDPVSGASAYLMEFEIGGDQFKVIWPVLPTKYEDSSIAAKRQAATYLFRDIKAKCLSAVIKGTRTAFFEYLRLPNGRTPPELVTEDLLQLPRFFEGFGVPQIEKE